MPTLENPLHAWNVAWYLVIAMTAALTAVLAREIWQKRTESRFRTTWIAFIIIAILQSALVVLTAWPTIPPALAHALEGASALLIGWGLAAPFLSRTVKRAWLIAAMATDLALSLLAFGVWKSLGVEPTWLLILWGMVSMVGVSASAIVLALSVKERPRLIIGALGVLGLGALLWTFSFGGEVIGRLLWLAAFITLPVGIMRLMLLDLEGTELELQAFSQHALRQTQELLVLQRASTTLVSQANVPSMLTEAVEGIALGAGADQALIALLRDDPDRTLSAAAIYPPRAGSNLITFPLNSHAVVAQAIYSNCPMILEQNIGLDHHVLFDLLGGCEAGPAIVQPMTSQDRTIGVMIVNNTHNQEPLGEGAGRLLEAFGAQIATAVENARMYHRLNAQARELASLLTIREEEASQRAAILESIADGVIVTNKQNKIIMANAAAANILGLTRSELIARSPQELVSPHIPLPFGAFSAPDAAHSPETLRTSFEINDRSVQASLALVQTPAGEHLGVVAVLRDITRERQAEQAKTEFIATVSHELRTPLTSIKGYADLLNGGVTGALNETQREFVAKVCHQTNRLVQLINAVIQYSELERSSPIAACQPFDMAELVNTVLDSLQERIKAGGITATFNAGLGVPQAYADPNRTRQIVNQLLDNAMRFTPAPGHITLSLHSVRSEQVSLAVSDTGVGIAPEELERVFERFYRTDNPMQFAAGGLGLGLTIARALATTQGGQLDAHSPAIERPDDSTFGDLPGSTFTLQLPAYAPE